MTPQQRIPLNKGHLTTRDTYLVPFWYFITLNDPLNKGHLWIKDTSLRGTPHYKGYLTTRDTYLVQFWNDPSTMDTSIKRTSLLVPMVSVIERLHCIQYYLTLVHVSMVLQISMLYSMTIHTRPDRETILNRCTSFTKTCYFSSSIRFFLITNQTEFTIWFDVTYTVQ